MVHQNWITYLISYGSGRNDSILLSNTYQGKKINDLAFALPDFYGANANGCHCCLCAARHARHAVRGARLRPDSKFHASGNALCGRGDQSIYHQH